MRTDTCPPSARTSASRQVFIGSVRRPRDQLHAKYHASTANSRQNRITRCGNPGTAKAPGGCSTQRSFRTTTPMVQTDTPFRSASVSRDTGATVVYRSMLLGGVFQSTGNRPPISVPLKGSYLFTDLSRFARRFRGMERTISSAGRDIHAVPQAELEALWDTEKAAERAAATDRSS